MKKKSRLDIAKRVNDYKTKHVEGFTNTEMCDLLAQFSKGVKERFLDALGAHTCKNIGGESLTYHHDIVKALQVAVENRKLHWLEWD